MKNFSVLHISDLHKINNDNVQCLISSFELEKEHYKAEHIIVPEIIVVSGDLVDGSNAKESPQQEIKNQYQNVSFFLNELSRIFLNGDKERIIIVPGNHDVSRYVSEASMNIVENTDVAILYKRLKGGSSSLRWSWNDLHFYEISDPGLYKERFDDFINFYNTFYDGLRKFPDDPLEQSFIVDLPYYNISFIGFNSCHNLDHLRCTGYIVPNALSCQTRALLDLNKKGRLIIGVWHHHVSGLPNEDNYLDSRILDSIVENSIKIVLHGHQHISGIINEYKDIFTDKKLWLLSAGALYGGSKELPFNTSRQYNIIEFKTVNLKCDVILHSRTDNSSNLFIIPKWACGKISNSNKSLFSFSVELSSPMSGEESVLFDINRLIKEVEINQDYRFAIDQLKKMDTDNPIIRGFLLDFIERVGGDKELLCKIITTPKNSREAILIIDSVIELGDKNKLKELLKSPFFLYSKDPSVLYMIDEANKYLKNK